MGRKNGGNGDPAERCSRGHTRTDRGSCECDWRSRRKPAMVTTRNPELDLITSDAPCRQSDPVLWDEEGNKGNATAAALCRGTLRGYQASPCPSFDTCLRLGMTPLRRDDSAVYAGLGRKQRARLHERMQAAGATDPVRFLHEENSDQPVTRAS